MAAPGHAQSLFADAAEPVSVAPGGTRGSGREGFASPASRAFRLRQSARPELASPWRLGADRRRPSAVPRDLPAPPLAGRAAPPPESQNPDSSPSSTPKTLAQLDRAVLNEDLRLPQNPKWSPLTRHALWDLFESKNSKSLTPSLAG